jgi:DNA-binding HxlR family transcriptional regulator
MAVTIADSQPIRTKKKIEKILEEKKSGTGLCAIQDFLDHLGDRWSMVVIFHIGYANKLRFNELKKRVTGISQRMLTVTLRSLERDGLVIRSIFAEIPPRVEYELSPLGASLLEAMMRLGEWAREHQSEIEQARRKFDKKK